MGIENLGKAIFTPIELQNKSNINLANTWFKDPKIYAEKILKSPAVTASITMPMQKLANDGNSIISQTVTIPFYMQDDFSCGDLQNKWSDVLSFDSFERFGQLLNGIVGGMSGSANIAIQSELMSLKSWKGSTFSGFNVNCLFVSTRRSIVPPEIITTLASSALPTKLKGDNTALAGAGAVMDQVGTWVEMGINFIGDAISDSLQNQKHKDAVSKATTSASATAKNALTDVGMVAPLHYGYNLTTDPSSGSEPGPIPNTTLTLQIGDWFRASELIVESISNIQYSKEVIAPASFSSFTDKRPGDLYDNSPDTGNEDVCEYPLWGRCSIKLIPARMMTKERYESYFLKKANNSTISKVKSALKSGNLSSIKNLFELPN